MRNALIVSALVTTCLLPALASEPGQPLDCSDWVALEPGYSCSEWLSYPCTSQGDFCRLVADLGPDNEGNLLATVRKYVGTDPSCGAGGQDIYRTEVVRHSGSDQTVIGYISDRCNYATGYMDRIRPRSWDSTIKFDSMNGTLYASFTVHCDGCGNYANGEWVALVAGFTPSFGIRQTFEPSSSSMGFRVPVKPDGMEGVDYFDTYYGTLDTSGDWSQALGLKCGYPAGTPNTGAYLTVIDTLATPEPGQGYYYVTAVTYLGETRYGRKRANGALSGRDPAVLPGCVE